MRRRPNAFVILGLLWLGVATGSLAAPPAQTNSTPDVPRLVFDAEAHSYQASPGELSAPFTINLTNVWTNDIFIDRATSSCTCTIAALPASPWLLKPHQSGQVHAQIKLTAKMGLVTKPVTFYYRVMPDNTILNHSIDLTVNVPPPPAMTGKMSEADRLAARAKARADAQSIFQGDCARCHADKGRDAMGEALYAADCGICHESSHRESAVPDLHALKHPTDFDYWKTIITFGKPTNMMPAFAASQGGPLNEAQIASLANYLSHTISHNFGDAKATKE